MYNLGGCTMSFSGAQMQQIFILPFKRFICSQDIQEGVEAGRPMYCRLPGLPSYTQSIKFALKQATRGI